MKISYLSMSGETPSGVSRIEPVYDLALPVPRFEFHRLGTMDGWSAARILYPRERRDGLASAKEIGLGSAGYFEQEQWNKARILLCSSRIAERQEEAAKAQFQVLVVYPWIR